MSEPTSSSVTPKSSQSHTPNLPVCSVPYRWQLHEGHYVSTYLDQAQPKATWERHTHPTVQILIFGREAECIIHWEVDKVHHQFDVHGEHIWVVGTEVPHWLEWHREALALVFYAKTDYVIETAGIKITGSALFSMQKVAKCDPKIPHFLSDFESVKQPDTEVERSHLHSLASIVTYRLFHAWDCLLQGGITHEPALSEVVLQRIDRFIDERLDTKILVVDVAREVGMSRTHFCRLFKRRMGLSLGQYLIGRRVERAKELLKDMDHRIGEIALAVGFSNQGHFDAFFKKLTGVTPTEFRNFLTIGR